MGPPDQGNKAQTLVGYSHGAGTSTGGPVTAVTGIIPQATPGVTGSARRWLCWTDGCIELDGKRPATGTWYSRKGVGPAHGPRRGSVRGPRRPLAPRSAQGIEGPLEGLENGKVGMLEGVWWCWRQCGGGSGGSMAIQWTIWWIN